MASADAAPVEELQEEDLSAMFKAKKKKKGPSAAAAGAEGGAVAAAGGAGSAAAAGGAAAPAPAPSSAFDDGEGADESYEDMLSRVYVLLNENNPELIGRERKKLKPPAVSRVGTTRTAWTNFKEICLGMKRNPDHVLSFFLAELGTTGSIDGSDRLLVRGKYQPKYIESLLRKYIQEFVICAMCRNLDTELTRDPISRLYFMNCRACGSARSVAAIKAGYHATAKGERKKAREALK